MHVLGVLTEIFGVEKSDIEEVKIPTPTVATWMWS